jgi:hypothetical protein
VTHREAAFHNPLSRRALLKRAAGVTAGALCGVNPLQLVRAETHPPIGTFPAGASGSSVFIGITVPRTGTYAVQGEDELKGYQLAVEHINGGHALIRKISPKTTKGLLGKEVKFGVADSEAKPNTAVQEQSRFISENKAVLITGSTSSAVAVALNKLAQREKVLYVAGISGSNDTTGKDCVRYGFRQCFYGQTAAAAIGPVVVSNLGKNKKAAYLTPDYTYGHTVQHSMEAGAVGGGRRKLRQLLSTRCHKILRGWPKNPVHGRRGVLPGRRSPARATGNHRPRQAAHRHEEQGRFLRGRRNRSGRGADAEARRLRLQSRQLHVIDATGIGHEKKPW